MKKVMCCLTSLMAVFMLLGFSIGVVQADSCDLPDIIDSSFNIPQDNPYLPMPDNMPEGRVYVYEAEDDGLIRDYQYFSMDTEPILGLNWTIVYDVEWAWVEAGDHYTGMAQWVKLEETEDYHIWDNDGNFWYGGEWTTAYEYDDEWHPTGSNNEGSWNANDPGVEPGIILQADPKVGDCYYEEFYEGEAEDQARVLRLNAKVSWEYADGECDNCGAFKEWTKLDPGNIEHKYYAPGLGLVYIEELKEKTVIFELVDITDDTTTGITVAPDRL